MASEVCMDKAMCKSQAARSPGAIKVYTPHNYGHPGVPIIIFM